jgi:hypothetical protein
MNAAQTRVVLTVLLHEGKLGAFRAFSRGKSAFQPTPPGSKHHRRATQI